MSTVTIRASGALFFVVILSATTLALAGDRSAAAILKEIEAITLPEADLSRVIDKAYLSEFMERRAKIRVRRAELIAELYRTDPENPRLAILLPVRWRSLSGRMAGPDNNEGARDLTAELNEVLARSKSAKLKTEAAFIKAWIASDPFDRMGSAKSKDAKAKAFDLKFNDAITGEEISMERLRGKIVVVDFWATWCGPCVAEMPPMKELYAKYHDKGVEFIGVSLDYPQDQGGLDTLKAFVTKNEIPWPQYYQGHGWESECSQRLGIDAVPSVFLVDQKGKLVSVDAGGKLETLINAAINAGR